jgi:protein-tyrosine phosphatase
MLPFLLLPALIVQAPQSAIPGAVEVRPSVFVLKGLPNNATCEAMKKQHITHVIDLRRDTEPNLDCESEASRLSDFGVQYLRYAITAAPPAGDFDFLRAIIRDLPKGSKVVVHCSNGNRAAAAVCPWLVLDKGMPVEEAITLSKQAGLKLPETEAAVRKYLGSKGRT